MRRFGFRKVILAVSAVGCLAIVGVFVRENVYIRRIRLGTERIEDIYRRIEATEERYVRALEAYSPGIYDNTRDIIGLESEQERNFREIKHEIETVLGQYERLWVPTFSWELHERYRQQVEKFNDLAARLKYGPRIASGP